MPNRAVLEEDVLRVIREHHAYPSTAEYLQVHKQMEGAIRSLPTAPTNREGVLDEAIQAIKKIPRYQRSGSACLQALEELKEKK